MVNPKSVFAQFYLIFFPLVLSAAGFHLRECRGETEGSGEVTVFYTGAASSNLRMTVKAGMKCNGGSLCHLLFTAL